MKIIFNNNLLNRFKCFIYNKKEDYSYVVWNRKPNKATCFICGDTLKSQSKMSYSPLQCGWIKIPYRHFYICHRCLEHRNFKPYIKQIDKDEDKLWQK